MTEETFDDETIEELETFFREAIARILEREDSEAFLAWVRQEAADRLPRLFERLPDEAARRSSASELGRALWSSVPLPGNGFRPRPLPEPERNDPWPCGSGLKYKKCCAPCSGRTRSAPTPSRASSKRPGRPWKRRGRTIPRAPPSALWR